MVEKRGFIILFIYLSLSYTINKETLEKKYPYFFTQCQAIHARSLLPCQDTPCIIVIY